MKTSRQHLMRLLFALLSVVSLTAVHAQQQGQYALYNYRNDGDFNAFLNIDIDSIRYSYIGLDSIEYDNVVVQEVWTPDSVYRIPIECIDSIGFRAPKPEFKDGIFHITESHVPYTESVDELTVTFDSSIPTSMLPSVGQVVISDVYDTPFDAGFAGRVKSIVQGSGTIRVVCDEVGLDDVYDQLICVGKTIAYEDDEEDYSSKPKAPRRIRINEDGTVELPLGKFSLDLLTHKEIDEFTSQPTGDKTNYVKITAKPSIIVDYAVKYNVKNQEDVFKFVLGFKSESEISLKWPKSVKLVDWEKYSNNFIPIPTSVPGLYSKICLGGFFKIEGDAKLEAKFPFTVQSNVGYDSQKESMGGIVFNLQGTKFEMPELSASVNASVSGGLALKYVTCIVAEKLASAEIKVKSGPKLSGKLEISTNGFADGGWSWYESMKDSKVTLEPLVITVSGGMKIFGKKKDWSYTLPIPDYVEALKKRELYLFPDFTKPTLSSIDKGKYLPTAMTTITTRNLLFPVYVGLRLYDESTDENYEYWCEDAYRWQNDWDNSKVQADMAKFASGRTFNIRPIFMNALYGTVKAKPETEFTVPEPLSLETNTVTIAKNQAQQVAVNGGWGDYSIFVLDKTVCSAELKTDGDNRYVQIVGLSKGKSTTVTVRDLRSQETKVVLVKVNETELQAVVKVEPTEIHFGNVPVSTTKTEHLTVSNIGTGNLTFSLNETHTIFDIPESGQEFTLAPGEEKVFDVNYTPTEVGGTSSRIVRVNSNAENGTQTVRIYGSGSEATSPSTTTYTVNGVSFKMVRVSGGTFQMGATAEQGSDAYSEEKPVHSVTLSDYAIGETEVTQALWQAVMGQTPTSDGYQWSSSKGLGADYPAYWVSWDDCQAFITQLNELTGLSFRLPTEAEWEFAARGGNSSQGYKYAGSNTLGDVAWYRDNSYSLGSSHPDYGTHAVGTKSPNELGLYDMSGNVWEWCQDWYDRNYYSNSPQDNPTGPASGSHPVLRGGSWSFNAGDCRVSRRFYDSPSDRYSDYGLRLAF